MRLDKLIARNRRRLAIQTAARALRERRRAARVAREVQAAAVQAQRRRDAESTAIVDWLRARGDAELRRAGYDVRLIRSVEWAAENGGPDSRNLGGSLCTVQKLGAEWITKQPAAGAGAMGPTPAAVRYSTND